MASAPPLPVAQSIQNMLDPTGSSSTTQSINAQQPTSKGVYWAGQDGNVWVKGAQGTHSAGAIDNNSANYWNNAGYKQIANPNPSTSGGAGTTTGGTTGGTTTTGGHLSQALIDAANASIAHEIAQNQSNYNAAAATNANNDQQQQLDQNTQVQNNTGSRADAVQNAEQAAATGNEGLKSVLASLGALNGTGAVLAGRAVANSANSDIGTANNTYTTNNQAIQKAISDYLTKVAARDAALKDSLNTDNRNARVTGIQNEVNEAENVGDTALVGQLLPQLVGATAPTQAITPNAVLYNGATVGAYSPTNSLNVSTAPTTSQSSTAPVNSVLNLRKTGSTPG